MLKKYFLVTSLRYKMTLSFSALIIFALTVLQAFNSYQTYIAMKKNLTDSVHESLRLGLSNIDYYVEDIDSLASGILSEPEIQNALSEKIDYNCLETKSTLRTLERCIKKHFSTKPYVPKVYLVNMENQILDNSLQGMTVVEKGNFTETSSLLLSDVHYAPYIGQQIPVISLEKNIYSAYQGNRMIGRLIVDMNTKVINQILDDFSLPMSGETFLINSKKSLLGRSGKYPMNDGTLINALDLSLSNGDGSLKIDNKKFLFLVETSLLTGWTLCALIPYNLFAHSIVIQMNMTLVLFLICIIAAIIISRQIVDSIYKPISMIITSMKEVEKGNLNSFVFYHNQDEFLSLVEGYNSMLTQIHHLIEQVKNKEQSKRNAELYALQAQINPHFLYNTLNSIRYLAKTQNASDIYDITMSLIHLSSASLDSDKFITISQELELTKDYLHIQKIRYGEDVVDYQCKVMYPDILACKIPRFSIQPLVENALFHGILPKGKGKIEVVSTRQNKDIIINIYDNGVGMSEEKVKNLNYLLETDQYQEYGNNSFEARKLKNIGIENVNHRVKLNFSPEYGLMIQPNVSGGLYVQLKIPALRKE